MTTKATTAVVNLTNPTITGTVTASSFSGPATQVTLVATNTTNATHYLNFTDAATGNEEIRTDTNLFYNPSTNTLTAGTFSGSGASLTNIVKTINSTSGDITLSSLADFTKSLAANGYQKFPGGFTIQWGSSSAAAVTFPVAFTTACYCVNLTRIAIGDTGGTDFANAVSTALSTTGFTASSAGAFYWMAVGR